MVLHMLHHGRGIFPRLCLARGLHLTSMRCLPRGVIRPELPESDTNLENWKDYITSRSQRHVPLGNDFRTAFGYVRFDEQNVVEYHGQMDDIEKREEDQSQETEETEENLLESFDEIKTAPSHHSSSTLQIEPGDQLFFENIVNMKEVKKLRFIHGKKTEIVSEAFADQDDKLRKVSSESIKNYINEIDQQYFGTITNPEESPTIELKRTFETEESKENPTSTSYSENSSPSSSNENFTPLSYSKDLSDLNYIDQQLMFGSELNEDFDSQTSVPKTDDFSAIEKSSFGDLNYFDQQIIFGDSSINRETVTNTKPKNETENYFSNLKSQNSAKSNIYVSVNEPDPQDAINILTTKSKEIKQQKKHLVKMSKDEKFSDGSSEKVGNSLKLEKSGQAQSEPETVNHESRIPKKFFRPVKGSAMEYVKQLRKQSILNPKVVEVTKSKEQEIGEIGVSLQKRLTNAASSTIMISSNKNVSRLDDDDDVVENYKSGRIHPKYLPQDFGKMTSVEVMEIFNNCILFDKYDIVGFFKPYGIPMFNESKSSHHSIEKYLPNLSKKLETEQLYQVHRLDQNTTGILLFAKTKEMHLKLTNLFRTRKIVKHYWAILNGTPIPAEGIINIPLTEKISGDNRYRIELKPDHKQGPFKTSGRDRSKGSILPAVTSYTTLATRDNASLVEVKPVTGFKHQIRAHMGLGLSCPVLGDHKYSYAEGFGKPQKVHGDILKRLNVRFSQARHLPLYLHAKKIQIPEVADGRDLVIEARLPHFFSRTMRKLKLDP